MQNSESIIKNIKNSSYLIDKEFLVWPENAFIGDKNIELIEKWNLKSYIKERKNFFSDDSVKKEYEEIHKKFNEEAISSYHVIISNLEEIYENCKRNKKIYYQDIMPTVKKVIEFYKKQKKIFIKYFRIPKLSANYHIIHSVNTAILTVALDNEMGLNNYKTVELCSIALLHKIGFLFIPSKISEKKEALTEEELEIIKKYPIISYKIASTSNLSRSICLTLLTHKENLDGTGYPKGLTSENISIESNIIGAASAYSAIILDKAYKKSFNSGASIIELIKDADKKFDKRVLKLIINAISSCPLDFIVELNDNSIAKIVDIDESNPNLPYINYIIKNGKVIDKNEQSSVQSIPNTNTGIKKILNQNEIELIKNKYSLIDII
ncbi:cyclic di-GMP phosphodiesterase PdeB [Borreliella burgdorferi]|uniref:cyclic di-GMP phosphodiesterase PdeB n=1 Tax=Borreliella burgdorferi TaxID=139 RepID=UPI001E46D018|nr:cyclic di-GMP phosphodiesterase PdeB [Borreliella burgdorferi]MCD2399313.1 cyclic di-GMP phosphodiesterase PdeB [Borreliella burgdorferi]MCD2399936.1 cyclic di-GMP phosphodiesterase PdeB [Borreliella burgdorferi]MCD2402204.1 cyclic di-GMP phosphodiesterase PdeB [Borreliella burgdorferi]MCD2403221.1 cyclic di-GMP phosphodiesterase PdeB [Borreliella burgdorferi]MCD2404116.1 cyclic di-GMP phosphodiesterase PdeB [Borreliella burgdorferi]